MKKTKLAVGVIAILGLGYVGTAWYTGNVIEDGLDSTLKNLTQEVNSLQDNFEVQITHTNDEKSLFSTKTHIKLAVTNIENSKTVVLYDDDVIIHHGPFPIEALKNGVFTPQQAWVEFQNSEQFNPDLWKKAGNQPFMKGHVSLSYSDFINYNISTQPIVFDLKDIGVEDADGKLDLGEINWRASGNINFVAPSISIEASKINYQHDADNQLKITNLKVVNDADFQNKYTLNASVDDFYFNFESARDTPEISLKNLAWNYELEAKESGLNGDFAFKIGSFKYGKQDIGNGSFEFDFEGLDKSFLEIYPEAAPFLAKIKHSSPNTKMNFKKVNWHNAAGDFNFSAFFDVSDFTIMSSLRLAQNIDQLNQFKVNLDAPYKVIARIKTQFDNPENENISEQQFESDAKQMQFIVERSFNRSPYPAILFKKGDVEGIFTEIEYTKQSGQFNLNGKKMSFQELQNHF
ncbi:DUF945 family protein [Gilliamella sp. B2911]|uniref:DUF945 family protein n=1 Tax=Gilliamella sp. B2911 TaxID=2817980 RepID=UPI002269C0AD|nr:DUF945 family protein [Gilliamella sp. B2911]MCX8662543.1 DUF945 family protein [Gilliamella sp. B2911]